MIGISVGGSPKNMTTTNYLAHLIQYDISALIFFALF